MHYSIWDEKPTGIQKILAHGRKQLLATVPLPGLKIVSGSYNSAAKLNEDWSYHLKVLNELVMNSRKRANERGWECDITLKYMADMWINQQGLCALTRSELDWKSGDLWDRNPYRASIDRLDSRMGYVKGNVRLVCHWANNAKSTWSDRVFRNMCQQAVMGFSVD